MSSVDRQLHLLSQRRLGLLENIVMLFWLYLAFVGGTWAVVSSFGVRLASLGILVGVLGWRFLPLVARDQALFRTPIDRPMLGLLAATVLATVFSINPRLSAETLALWVGYALLFQAMFSIFTTRPTLAIAPLLGAALALSLASAAEPLLWYFGLAPSAGYTVAWPSVASPGEWLPPAWLRPKLLAGNPNVLAGFVAPLVPISLALAMRAKHAMTRCAASVATALLVIGTLATASRGGLVAMLAGIACFVLARKAPRMIRPARRLLQSRLGVAVLIVAVASATLLAWRMLPRAGAQSGSEGVRVELWGYALSTIVERPLFGAGPDTFGAIVLQRRPPDARPEDLLPHPHNVYLGLAAEIGLLGLLTALWLGASVLKSWWIRARNSDREKQMLPAGILAGLTTMAVHGIFEDFRMFPLIVVEGIALTAICLAPSVAVNASGGQRARVLFAPAVVVLAFCVFTTFTRWGMELGARFAAAGQWEEAERHLRAVAMQEPLLPFYSVQLAGAEAWLARDRNDPAALQAAIMGHRLAAAFEPNYAPHHAHLGALLWEQGDRAGGISSMQRAVARAPREPAYRLVLAAFYQSEGYWPEADRELVGLLVSDPGIAHLRLWQNVVTDTTRQNELLDRAWSEAERLSPAQRGIARGKLAIIRHDWASATAELRGALRQDGTLAEAWQFQGEALIRSGATSEGIAALRTAARMAGRQAVTHALLAEALAGDGWHVEADREARIALFLEPDNSVALVVLARLARQRGNVGEAAARYRAALANPLSYVAYSLSVWRRPGLNRSDIPQLAISAATDRDAAVYQEFADFLTSEGKQEEASEVLRKWREFDPFEQGSVKGIATKAANIERSGQGTNGRLP